MGELARKSPSFGDLIPFNSSRKFLECDLIVAAHRAVAMRPWRNWIAHRSSEPRVEGSNPSGRTRLILRTLGYTPVRGVRGFLLRRLDR